MSHKRHKRHKRCCLLCLLWLKHHFKSKLKFTGSAAPERRIVIRDVGRRLRRAKAARGREWRVAAGAIELRVAVLSLIEKVEDLGAELACEFLAEFPIFHHRAVPRMKAIASECISAHRAGASDSWR